MTYEELLEWGRKESEIRMQELSDIKSEDHLKQIQANAKARRKAAGISRADATHAVLAAR